jgi:hypothetical protein
VDPRILLRLVQTFGEQVDLTGTGGHTLRHTHGLRRRHRGRRPRSYGRAHLR